MQPKILLVDDREDNLLSIESIFEPDGYRFVKPNSGRQALKILLQEFDFAMILMDVKMPNLNGFETAALIYEREKLKHIPIIFITGHADVPMSVRAMKAGAVEFLTKPFRGQELLDAIQEAIAKDRVAWTERAQMSELRARYDSLMQMLPQIAALPDAAATLAKLRKAALADDTGAALTAAMKAIQPLQQAAE